MLQKETNPTTLLTGFLGAGKTSLLNHLISSNPDKKYAVIENEFGKENIDSELVLRGESDIIELNDGCLCCTLNENLYDMLNDLYDRRNDFDELIIEATGVADPAGLAAPFLLNPGIKKQFPLAGIICLVDCEQIEDLLEETEEAKRQIAYSDLIVLNKLDLVSTSYVQYLHNMLKHSNPLATIVHGLESVEAQISVASIRAIERLLEDANFELDGNYFPHAHTTNLESLTLKFSEPFLNQELRHRLLVYLTFQAKDLYRMKGVVYTQGDEERMIVQSVGKRFSVEEGRPWATDKRESVIVFIGRDIKRQKTGLQKLLHTCLATKIHS